MKQKQPSILERIKKRGTFQDILPDEEQFITDTSAGGLNEEQIIDALQTRRQDLANGIVVQGEDGIQLANDGEEQTGETAVNPDPYGGRSKQEVIMMAFQSGITKKSALKEIGDTYDMVMGLEGGDEKEQLKQDNFSYAREIIEFNADNPDATRENLKATLLQETGLESGAIDALLNESGAKSRDDLLDSDTAKTIAKNMVVEKTGFFTDSKQGKADAIAEVEEDTTLTSFEKKMILDEIEKQYPTGRTFLNKLFDGGKEEEE